MLKIKKYCIYKEDCPIAIKKAENLLDCNFSLTAQDILLISNFINTSSHKYLLRNHVCLLNEMLKEDNIFKRSLSKLIYVHQQVFIDIPIDVI